jgi:amidophosphoribosyltransferase
MTADQPSLDHRDGPRDECGVFGIYGPEHDVSRLTYFALYALQHRGQESAGIAAADAGGYIITQRALGLVSQVFKEHDLRALDGELAIGHVRYSTTGSNEWENSQPVHRSAGAGGGNRREIALAHNGNLINASSCTPSCASAASRSPRRRTPRSSPRCWPPTRPRTWRTRSPPCCHGCRAPSRRS